jgi:hypothetical protein
VRYGSTTVAVPYYTQGAVAGRAVSDLAALPQAIAVMEVIEVEVEWPATSGERCWTYSTR